MHPHRFRLQGTLKLLTLLMLSLASIFIFVQPSVAHESKPAVAMISVNDDGIVNVNIVTNVEALIAGLGPDHNPGEFAKASRYAALRKMSSEELKQALNDFTGTFLEGIELRADDKLLITSLQSSEIPDEYNPKQARESTLKVAAKLPENAKTLSWQWNKDFGVIALRLNSTTIEDVFNAYLEPGVRSESFELAKLQAKPMGEFLGAMPTEYPEWFKDSFLEFADDIEEATAEGKRLAILFHQDGCPYCNLLVERNLAQQDIEALMKEKFDVISINMWGARELISVGGKAYTERDFSAALKVQYTPTMLFFNEKGKLALRLNGYLKPAEFKRALNYVADKQETKISYADYVAANRVVATNAGLNNQSFFDQSSFDFSLPESGFEKPLAVFFEQSNCPNCDNLHQTVLAGVDTAKTIDQFRNVQLDMWSDTKVVTPEGIGMSAKEWAKQLKINYAPSIVLFDKQGKEIIRIEAMFKAFHTESVFDYVLSEAYKAEPSFQTYISHRADAIRETGETVDLWK